MSHRNYRASIGLEIHAQLATEKKLFSPVSTEFGAGTNELASEICLGFPGTLPRLNPRALSMAVLAGLALNCRIHRFSRFDRKQYFYPDLPKGYQITQYTHPLCGEGWVEFYWQGQKKRVAVERAHLEEDAGRLLHRGEYSLVNYNRAGIPLLEIVSAPELTSPGEAAQYAKTVASLLKNIRVSSGHLEEGALRCDCNISLELGRSKKLGKRVELKNINSFRFIERALEYEIHRQAALLNSGREVLEETRGYDPKGGNTFPLRNKEGAGDYRYFPEADLPAIELSGEYIQRHREKLPPSPTELYEVYLGDFGLREAEAEFLSHNPDYSALFAQVNETSPSPKKSAHWIFGEFLKLARRHKVEVARAPVRGRDLGILIGKLDSGELSPPRAREIFGKMWFTGKSVEYFVTRESSRQLPPEKTPGKAKNQEGTPGEKQGEVLGETLEEWVRRGTGKKPKGPGEIPDGEAKSLGFFFVGQVMELSRGRADPIQVREQLQKKFKGV